MFKESIASVRVWRGPLGISLDHLVIGLLLVALLAGGYSGWRGYAASQQEWVPGTMPVSQEIEEKFGVRFNFLAVTAGGGMVELRYRVVDAGKAANFGHFTETAPMLIAEDTGKIVDVTIMGLHNHRVEPGRTYYVLYRNTETAVQSGRPVTIRIGNLDLEHVVPW
jgi:hypothetical protein